MICFRKCTIYWLRVPTTAAAAGSECPRGPYDHQVQRRSPKIFIQSAMTCSEWAVMLPSHCAVTRRGEEQRVAAADSTGWSRSRSSVGIAVCTQRYQKCRPRHRTSPTGTGCRATPRRSWHANRWRIGSATVIINDRPAASHPAGERVTWCNTYARSACSWFTVVKTVLNETVVLCSSHRHRQSSAYKIQPVVFGDIIIMYGGDELYTTRGHRLRSASTAAATTVVGWLNVLVVTLGTWLYGERYVTCSWKL